MNRNLSPRQFTTARVSQMVSGDSGLLVRDHPSQLDTEGRAKVDSLKKDIEANGVQEPLVVSRRGDLLVDGHHRAIAAIELGLKKVPVTKSPFH